MSSGALVSSSTHIRSAGHYGIRPGPVTIKVAPGYESAVAFFNDSYGYLSTTAFANEQTVTAPAGTAYFKAILRRVPATDAIVPSAIESALLKVENSNTATQWNPHFYDLGFEDQKDFFSLELSSSNGWTVKTNDFSTQLKATLLLFNEDVTPRYSPGDITWFRQYPGGVRAAIGSGPTYNVTPAEVAESATYEVEFTVEMTEYLITTLDGDVVLTIDDEGILAIGIDDAALVVKKQQVMVRDVVDRLIAAESSITQLADNITLRVLTSTYNAGMNSVQQSVGELSVRSDNIQLALNGARHRFTAQDYTFYDASGGEVFSLSKGMANQDNDSSGDNVESGSPLRKRIHIGDTVSSVHQVILKWANYPYRSSAKSAAAGGNSVVTSASGGGVSTTSGAGGGATLATGTNGLGSGMETGTPIYGTGLDHRHVYYTGYHSHYLDLPWHYHSLTLAAHQHSLSLPTHVHDIVFGIVELAITSYALEIVVNGTTRASVNASSGSVDLTPWITTNGWHDIEVRSTTRKRVEVSLFMSNYIRR